MRIPIQGGADPNARETGDNASPLHWAAADRNMETVRALLDAGGDPHGLGDLHELDAIGWATFGANPPYNRRTRRLSIYLTWSMSAKDLFAKPLSPGANEG